MVLPKRVGIGGPISLSQVVSVTVPNITAPATADVALPANASFIGAASRPVRASFAAAPLANLGIVGAWVSNTATGVVSIRFIAGTGNVATAAQSVYVEIEQ